MDSISVSFKSPLERDFGRYYLYLKINPWFCTLKFGACDRFEFEHKCPSRHFSTTTVTCLLLYRKYQEKSTAKSIAYLEWNDFCIDSLNMWLNSQHACNNLIQFDDSYYGSNIQFDIHDSKTIIVTRMMEWERFRLGHTAEGNGFCSLFLPFPI